MSPPVAPLHRHQLAHLTASGWRHVAVAPWDADARACLALWASRRLPLVVTRQDAQAPDVVSLGLPAPAPWRGRRIAVTVPRDQLGDLAEFPTVDAVPLTPASAWTALAAAMAAAGATARVYGSHGWQALTGLNHVHAGSDVDLWVAVDTAAQADAVATALQAADDGMAPRLDGELAFPDGRAFAWREWQAWRAGRARTVLGRTLTWVGLVQGPFEDAARC